MGISGLCRDMCSRKSVKRCSLLFLQSYIFNLVSRCFAIGKARCNFGKTYMPFG